MPNNFSYARFQESYPLTHDDVINHVIGKFFPTYNEKRRQTAFNNLSIIFDATFRLSARNGFAYMTVRNLQKETGISMGGLYNYFASKEELERMIVEGLYFITAYSCSLPPPNDQSSVNMLKHHIKGYVYISERFKPWYYFVFMELRTMAPANVHRVQELQVLFLEKLSLQMNSSQALSSDLCVIIQDFYLRSWKYENVPIEQFAEHCLSLALIMKQHALSLTDLQLNYGPSDPSGSSETSD